MRIEHIALWTPDLDRFKRFYVDYFGAVAGSGYVNAAKGFESCFLSFGDGARIEAMTTTTLDPIAGLGRTGRRPHAAARGRWLSGARRPRRTGDGYYESVVLDPDGNRVEITS